MLKQRSNKGLLYKTAKDNLFNPRTHYRVPSITTIILLQLQTSIIQWLTLLSPPSIHVLYQLLNPSILIRHGLRMVLLIASLLLDSLSRFLNVEEEMRQVRLSMMDHSGVSKKKKEVYTKQEYANQGYTNQEYSNDYMNANQEYTKREYTKPKDYTKPEDYTSNHSNHTNNSNTNNSNTNNNNNCITNHNNNHSNSNHTNSNHNNTNTSTTTSKIFYSKGTQANFYPHFPKHDDDHCTTASTTHRANLSSKTRIPSYKYDSPHLMSKVTNGNTKYSRSLSPVSPSQSTPRFSQSTLPPSERKSNIPRMKCHLLTPATSTTTTTFLKSASSSSSSSGSTHKHWSKKELSDDKKRSLGRLCAACSN
ncbi:hypothetical protein BDB01DRAFT_907741 [Pilobolus umbonatus]|nr:hypothetical protein BDB01DRAFT_907741 [Pilobolus umbonatus]